MKLLAALLLALLLLASGHEARAATWTGTLGSTGGTDQLIFTNSSFVAGPGTGQIQFDVGGTLYAADFKQIDVTTLEAFPGLSPVPEPSTIFGASALVLAIVWRERKRLIRLVRKPPAGAGPARERF